MCSGQTLTQLLRDKRIRRKKILAVGASSIEDICMARECGADFSILCHFGHYPIQQRDFVTGMLPYGSANDIVLALGKEILPMCTEYPVIASVCAADPFRRIELHIASLKRQGFAGVMNYPSVGVIDGNMRANLEENNSGYRRELQLMRDVGQTAGMRCGIAFTEKDAKQMAETGVEMLVLHESIGKYQTGCTADLSSTVTDSASFQRLVDTCRSVHPDILLLYARWQVENPTSVEATLTATPGLDGYMDMSCFSKRKIEKHEQRLRALAQL